MTKATLVRRPHRRTLSNPTTGMDRFFEDFFGSAMERADEGLADRPWRPAVDVRETDTTFEVSAELPGLTKKEVEITFDNGVLSIKGERQFEDSTTEGNYHRIERRYGAFSRSFVLPTEVDTQNVKATFKSGLLTINLPKAPDAKARRIEVKGN